MLPYSPLLRLGVGSARCKTGRISDTCSAGSRGGRGRPCRSLPSKRSPRTLGRERLWARGLPRRISAGLPLPGHVPALLLALPQQRRPSARPDGGELCMCPASSSLSRAWRRHACHSPAGCGLCCTQIWLDPVGAPVLRRWGAEHKTSRLIICATTGSLLHPRTLSHNSRTQAHPCLVHQVHAIESARAHSPYCDSRR